MAASRKIFVLLVAMMILAAGLFTTIGRTYAYNAIIPQGNDANNLQIGLEKYVDDKWESVVNGSTDHLFADTIWEPGAMRAVSLKVTNLASTNSNSTPSYSFKHWFYPYSQKPSDPSYANSAYLAEVMDVYLYIHPAGQANILMNGNRPDLEQFLYLGKLNTLDGINIPNKVNGASVVLNPGESQCYTLVLKMNESAGNEYQGAVAEVYAVVRAEQTT